MLEYKVVIVVESRTEQSFTQVYENGTGHFIELSKPLAKAEMSLNPWILRHDVGR